MILIVQGTYSLTKLTYCVVEIVFYFCRSSDTGNTCSPSEISFAVKQLLMKYLPNDQLAKMACIQKSATANNNKFIRKRPEFSFATLQYMEKYNLLAPGNIKKGNS